MKTITPISEVFCEDNMVGMARYPDKFFDLAIVDPPYGSSIMGKNKLQRHKTTDTTYRNKTIPSPEYFSELARVAKRSIIWGCQYMMPFLSPDGSFIIWDKGADPDLHNMSACDVAWYSKRERIRKWRGAWCGAVKCESEPTIHIHQKPMGLYRWLLKHYALPGEKIIDTHMGSQSSRIAAFTMGFDYWGWEIDKDYFEAGNKRFKEQTAQQSIF
jgi:site-specific DNA-methyltransferase (adenine-specific)